MKEDGNKLDSGGSTADDDRRRGVRYGRFWPIFGGATGVVGLLNLNWWIALPSAVVGALVVSVCVDDRNRRGLLSALASRRFRVLVLVSTLAFVGGFYARGAVIRFSNLELPDLSLGQVGSFGSNTFANPHNASGSGPRIAPDQKVRVSCKVYAPNIPSVTPDGYWYRIASSPWDDRYYAPANTFWNGDVPGERPYTHNTDFSIPDC